MSEPLTLDQAGVLEVLPHREPFLFVHGVSDLAPGQRARGFVSVPADHPYTFGQPHVPAGLLIEAMAQLGGIAVLYERRDEDIVALFRSVADFSMERTVDFGEANRSLRRGGTHPGTVRRGEDVGEHRRRAGRLRHPRLRAAGE